jgi:hypothetical protein
MQKWVARGRDRWRAPSSHSLFTNFLLDVAWAETLYQKTISFPTRLLRQNIEKNVLNFFNVIYKSQQAFYVENLNDTAAYTESFFFFSSAVMNQVLLHAPLQNHF